MKKTILTLVVLAAATAVRATWDEQAVLARRLTADAFLLDKQAYLAQSAYTNGVFFDYDNDGLLDLLIVGRGGDWNIKADVRIVALYRNLGAEADYRLQRVAATGLEPFTDEGYYNPVSAGDVNHDGYTDLLVMTYHGGRHVDLYLNDQGTGRFLRQQDVQIEAATNGSCMFGDLDGDGWLDIELSGYSDRSATALKLYRNLHDGAFADVSQGNVTGAFQGGSALADINGDGRLDIIATGNGNNWVCLAPIYLSQGNGTFTPIPESKSGLKGVSRATPLVVDLNADGLMDIITNGEPSDGSGFRTHIYYQKADGTFLLDTSYPLIPVNQDGGINMGDADADGNMDIIIGGWTGTGAPAGCYSSPLRVYENHPEDAGLPGNRRPEAPASVSAVVEGDSLIITWTPGSDHESAAVALRYNLYVRHDDTGLLYTLIPADPLSGRLLVGTDLQTSLSSGVHRYALRHFGAGSYTVGVQTLDQAYAPSPFTTATTAEHSGVGEHQAAPSLSRQYYALDGSRLPASPSKSGFYIQRSGTSTKKLLLK